MDGGFPGASGKRERTRARLIEATVAVVGERGIAGASLDEIAARAGMTKGAIYSNFKDRDALLAAVRTARFPLFKPRLEPGAPLRVQLEAFAEAVIETLPENGALSRFLTEYQLQAHDDAAFRLDLARQYAALFDGMGPFFERCPDELSIPGRDLMVIVQSLLMGFVYQAYLTPDEVTPDIVRHAFVSLAEGAVARG